MVDVVRRFILAISGEPLWVMNAVGIRRWPHSTGYDSAYQNVDNFTITKGRNLINSAYLLTRRGPLPFQKIRSTGVIICLLILFTPWDRVENWINEGHKCINCDSTKGKMVLRNYLNPLDLTAAFPSSFKISEIIRNLDYKVGPAKLMISFFIDLIVLFVHTFIVLLVYGLNFLHNTEC